MAIGETAFPGDIDSLSTLLRLGLGTETTLLQDVTDAMLTIRVGNPSLLSSPDGVILLENEWVTYSGITGDTLTVETRGAFQSDGGYPASAHRNGARIVQFMTEMHHRVLADAIAATQGKLGTGASTPDTDAFLVGTGSGPSAWKELFAPAVLSLPTADVSHRGKVKRVDGATGIADRLAYQRKNAGDIHEWADIPTLVGPAKGVLPVFNAADYGTLTSNDQGAAAANAATIARAIAAAKAAGGGRIIIPHIGGPTSPLYLSSVAAPAAVFTLDSTYSHIWIEGMGRHLTYLKVADATDRLILAFNGATLCTLRNLTLDNNAANQTTSSLGHLTGLHGLSISGVGHVVEGVCVRNTGGYGYACAQGSSGPTASIQDSWFLNCEAHDTGSDAFESKDSLGENITCFIQNFVATNWGTLSTAGSFQGDKTGIDCSGPWAVDGVSLTLTHVDHADTGFRFRPRDTSTGGISSLTNFYIKGPGAAALAGEGVDMGSEFNHVANGHIEGWGTGLLFAGYDNCDGTAANVTIRNCVNGLQLRQDAGARLVASNVVIRDCDNAVLGRSSGHVLSDFIIRDCVRGYWFSESVSPAWTSDKNVVRGGKLIGTFTQTLRTDAGCADNIFEGVDLREISSGSIIDNGERTIIRNCPGLPGRNTLIFTSQLADRTDADVSTAQNIFDAAVDTLTLTALTTYLFKLVLHVSSLGTTSANMQVLFAGSATFTSFTSAQRSNNPATETRGATVESWGVGATPAVGATQTVAAARFHTVVLEGLIRCNVAGTIIPQYKFSAAPGAAPIVYQDSFMTLTPVGPNTMQSSGGWA